MAVAESPSSYEIPVYRDPGARPAPAILRLEPRPRGLLVNRTADGPFAATSLTLIWDGADGERCRRCPRELCGLSPLGICTVLVPDRIADRDCPAFRLADWIAERGAGVGVEGAGGSELGA